MIMADNLYLTCKAIEFKIKISLKLLALVVNCQRCITSWVIKDVAICFANGSVIHNLTEAFKRKVGINRHFLPSTLQ